MNLPLLIQSLTAQLQQQQVQVAEMDKELILLQTQARELLAENERLKKQLSAYQNKKDSSNSHTPPSQDPHRPKKNQSLREPSGKKPGGQPGHQGNTLQYSTTVDEVLDYQPDYCTCCGENLSNVAGSLVETRQEIDTPVIRPVCTAHRIYQKTCTCGQQTQSSFPAHITASVQYGANTESLIGYLHARQYMPYKRMQELLADVLGLPISTGGINHVLNRLVQKALPHYQQIKERIIQSVFVGTDETRLKRNSISLLLLEKVPERRMRL